MSTQVELQGILYQALSEPIGLLLRSSDPVRCRMRLYQARTAAGDPALALLQFRLAGGIAGGDLVICKGKSMAQEAREAEWAGEGMGDE